jgi:hypothetical protein
VYHRYQALPRYVISVTAVAPQTATPSSKKKKKENADDNISTLPLASRQTPPQHTRPPTHTPIHPYSPASGVLSLSRTVSPGEGGEGGGMHIPREEHASPPGRGVNRRGGERERGTPRPGREGKGGVGSRLGGEEMLRVLALEEKAKAAEGIAREAR